MRNQDKLFIINIFKKCNTSVKRKFSIVNIYENRGWSWREATILWLFVKFTIFKFRQILTFLKLRAKDLLEIPTRVYFWWNCEKFETDFNFFAELRWKAASGWQEPTDVCVGFNFISVNNLVFHFLFDLCRIFIILIYVFIFLSWTLKYFVFT